MPLNFFVTSIAGDFDLCRNLARIAASVCQTWVNTINHSDSTKSREPESGAVTILLKGASHPSINICAICLEILTKMISLDSSLSLKLLPVLQRRAIIPHHLKDGQIELDSTEITTVPISEFQTFRQTILSDALASCWNVDETHYMDSCTSAIEEFCSDSSSIDVSLQTEAALFCIGHVTIENTSQQRFPSDVVMNRLVKALITKPPKLMANPLTRESLCRFIRKVGDTENVSLGFFPF